MCGRAKVGNGWGASSCARSSRRRWYVVSLTTALSSIGTATRRVSLISTQTTGGPFLHQVVAGESLVSLGARHGIDPREIALANGITPGAAIAPGLTLRLDNRHVVPLLENEVALVINVPQRMLFFTGGEPVIGCPAGLGRRDWPTPLGEFSVIVKEENPTWDVPASIRRRCGARAARWCRRLPRVRPTR